MLFNKITAFRVNFLLFSLEVTEIPLPLHQQTNKQTKGKRKAADLKGRFLHITFNRKGRQFFLSHQQTNQVFTEKWKLWYRKLQKKLPVNVCEPCRTENRLPYNVRTATI